MRELKAEKLFCRYMAAVLLVLLWIAPCLAELKFPQPSGLVNDFADVIPPEFEEKITAVTAELLKKTEIPVAVVTMPDIGGADADEYANRLYEAWGIGKKGVDKGILIFVAVKERKMRIEVGYGLEGVIPDGKAGEIRDKYMIPYLSKNQFGEGLLNGTLAVAQIIARDAGVELTGAGQASPAAGQRGRSGCGVLPGLLIFMAALVLLSRSRMGPWLLLALLSGARGGGSRSGGFGGGFGSFGGGFGGFGGGSSGGGGAGGSF